MALQTIHPVAVKAVALKKGVRGPARRRARASTAHDLGVLGEEDRLLLEQYQTVPLQFTDDPLLHEPGAEEALFGEVAVLADPDGTRFVDPPLNRDDSPVGRLPTLTGDQERTLFLRYNFARMRMSELVAESGGQPLSPSAARHLLAWGHRALDLRATIAQKNLPLVMAMAKRTKLCSIDYNDLISEGNMALLRSVEKFDCSRGFKFSTYSCRAILKSFSRVAMRASRYRGRFPAQFDPAIEKSDYQDRRREEVEFDCVDELKEILLRNLADLSAVEDTVIRERFAIAKDPVDPAAPKTLEQVGLIIGVTKERVRQIQNKALQKIRVALEEKYLAA